MSTYTDILGDNVELTLTIKVTIKHHWSGLNKNLNYCKND